MSTTRVLARTLCRTFAAIVLVQGASACRERDESALKADAPPPLACAAGDPASFTLTPLEWAPLVNEIKFSGQTGPSSWELTKQDPSQSVYIRLDACVTDTDVKLERVLYSPISFSPLLVYKTTPESTVEGLKEAIFDSDESKLKIYLSNGGSSWLVIQGWKQAGGTFATAVKAKIMQPGSKVNPTASSLLTGKLAFGDPLKDVKCAAGQAYQKVAFGIGSARIDAEICTGLGGGETTSYVIISLGVTDANPLVPAELRVRQEFVGIEAVKSVMTYVWNHHNACDSFHIKLPHADYAATSSPVAGCGAAVSDAPVRTFDEPFGVTKFRTRYGQAAWTEGSMACAHFMFNCPDPGQ